jgi:hypothetical protein
MFLLSIGGLLHAHSASVQGLQEPRVLTEANDSTLFEATIQHILGKLRNPELRVDPRPLKHDPGLVTLKGVETVIPDRVAPDAHYAPLADSRVAITEARRNLLSEMGLAETDAFKDARCPGVMIPPTPAVDEMKRELCPSTRYSSVIIALPREGGSHWPANVDERSKYGNRPVYSVRVIETSLHPRGSVEMSSDYIFERLADNQWKLLEVRGLLIVE